MWFLTSRGPAAVELDPRSSICRLCYAVALTVASHEGEAAREFEWLERQPADDYLATVALRFRRGLNGDRAAVLSPLDAAECAMAEVDEYWAYLMGRSLLPDRRSGAGTKLAGA